MRKNNIRADGQNGEGDVKVEKHVEKNDLVCEFAGRTRDCTRGLAACC